MNDDIRPDAIRPDAIRPVEHVEDVPDGDERVNTFKDPGGNYPDAGRGDEVERAERAEASADHFGQDGDRGTLTAGESQRALGDAAEQSLPAMDQNNASADEKLQGIVEQTIADSEFQPKERLEQHLRDRIRDSGLVVSDDELQAALRAVHGAIDA